VATCGRLFKRWNSAQPQATVRKPGKVIPADRSVAELRVAMNHGSQPSSEACGVKRGSQLKIEAHNMQNCAEAASMFGVRSWLFDVLRF